MIKSPGARLLILRDSSFLFIITLKPDNTEAVALDYSRGVWLAAQS